MTKADVSFHDPEAFFKVCTKCKTVWKSREDFIKDPQVKIIGFMANNESVEDGVYLFNHLLPDNACNTTMGLFVADFLDLYEGQIYSELEMGSKNCSGHCRKIDDLEQCRAHCRNAVARHIIQKLLKRNIR